MIDRLLLKRAYHSVVVKHDYVPVHNLPLIAAAKRPGVLTIDHKKLILWPRLLCHMTTTNSTRNQVQFESYFFF